MLNWITSRLSRGAEDSEHPLGTDKAIDAFLAEMPTVDPQRTLREILDWLGDPPSLLDALPLPRAVRAVERLDEAAQDAVARCWDVLLAEAKAHRPFQPVAGLLKTFFSGSHACNRQALERLATDPEQAADKRRLATFAARAMYNGVQLKKLGRMTYQAAESAWWIDAHALADRARGLGILDTTLVVYPRQPLMSTTRREYHVGVLFETAPITNLTVNELEATDRLVRWIEPHCRFVEAPTSLTPFCILPEGGNSPTRRQEDKDYPSETRYFGIGQGQAHLTQLSTTIARDEQLPEWLAASHCTHQQIQLLLKKLVMNWSATPPSRRHPRLTAKGAIRVVNGLDMVRRMLAASEFAKSGRDLDYDSYLRSASARHREHSVVTKEEPAPAPKDPMEILRRLETAGDQQMMEQWEISDISRGGMGVRFVARRPWQRIGALIAYRMDDELNWHIGIIRRLGSSHGRPNAGLSCFGGSPACAQVRLASRPMETNAWDQQTAETSGHGWHNAILLSAEAKLLLVPPALFAPSRALHVSIQGQWRPARFLKLHGRGHDYDLVSFLEEDAQAGA